MAVDHPERGSALIWLLVGVALFGLVTTTFLQGSRNNLSMFNATSKDAVAIGTADCSNAINLASKRLTMRGCATISFDPNGALNGGPADGSCAVFTVKGGGVKKCKGIGPMCVLADLTAIGHRCGGIVYAGRSPDGNKRMYVTESDGPSLPWNNGNGSGFLTTGATSTTSGSSNTAKLKRGGVNQDSSTAAGIQPHQAAQYCADLRLNDRTDWYLPAPLELQVVYTNRVAIGNYLSGMYWTSLQSALGKGFGGNAVTGTGDANQSKNVTNKIRCTLKD